MRTNAELSTSIRDILDDPTMKDKLSDNQRATLKDAERALLKDGDPFADMLGSMFKAAPSILLAQYDGENEVMTVHYSNGDVARFKGTGTVWNKMPMMARCSTQLEQTLTSILTYVKQWGQSLSQCSCHERRSEVNTMRIPASKEEFLYLIGESREELVEMGFREWGTLNNIIRKEIVHFPDPSLPKEPYSDEDDKTIMLIPHSWYDFIPEGYALVDIFGGPLEFCHGKTSDDHRGGMLAYGVLRPANEMKQP